MICTTVMNGYYVSGAPRDGKVRRNLLAGQKVSLISHLFTFNSIMKREQWAFCTRRGDRYHHSDASGEIHYRNHEFAEPFLLLIESDAVSGHPITVAIDKKNYTPY